MSVTSIVESSGQQIPESGQWPFAAAPLSLSEVTNAKKIPSGNHCFQLPD
jgi:hypothetical protein